MQICPPCIAEAYENLASFTRSGLPSPCSVGQNQPAESCNLVCRYPYGFRNLVIDTATYPLVPMWLNLPHLWTPPTGAWCWPGWGLMQLHRIGPHGGTTFWHHPWPGCFFVAGSGPCQAISACLIGPTDQILPMGEPGIIHPACRPEKVRCHCT